MDTTSSPDRLKATATGEPMNLLSPSNVVLKRKRGRPSSKALSYPTEIEEAVWSTRMIETLLDEKIVLKAFFLKAQNKQKLAVGGLNSHLQ
jgi:hypothetical protein